jgi:hypothetical protein
MTVRPSDLPIPASHLALLPFDILEATPSAVLVRTASGHEINLHDVVQHLAWRARGKRYPRKSIAAVLREGIQSGEHNLTREEAEVVKDLAVDALHRSGLRAVEDEAWCTIADAAKALRVSVSRIRTMLETDSGRRQLGWPWRVDEMEWRIPMAALRPNRAEYVQGLPVTDPYKSGQEPCDSVSGCR